MRARRPRHRSRSSGIRPAADRNRTGPRSRIGLADTSPPSRRLARRAGGGRRTAGIATRIAVLPRVAVWRQCVLLVRAAARLPQGCTTCRACGQFPPDYRFQDEEFTCVSRGSSPPPAARPERRRPFVQARPTRSWPVMRGRHLSSTSPALRAARPIAVPHMPTPAPPKPPPAIPGARGPARFAEIVATLHAIRNCFTPDCAGVAQTTCPSRR